MKCWSMLWNILQSLVKCRCDNMETLAILLVFCGGNTTGPCWFPPTEEQWYGILMFLIVCLHKLLYKQSLCQCLRHHVEYVASL